MGGVVCVILHLAVSVGYRRVTRDAESSFFVGLQLQGLKKIGTPTPVLKKSPDSDSGLVGHRLLNLCDCDSVLTERCRRTNSEDFFKQSISIRSYLNLISVIACSKTVHNIMKQNLNYRHQQTLSNVLVVPVTARL